MDGSTQTKLESAQDIPKQVLITKKNGIKNDKI